LKEGSKGKQSYQQPLVRVRIYHDVEIPGRGVVQILPQQGFTLPGALSLDDVLSAGIMSGGIPNQGYNPPATMLAYALAILTFRTKIRGELRK
jgi:hypothetical protein